jgi:hypothetical protein
MTAAQGPSLHVHGKDTDDPNRIYRNDKIVRWKGSGTKVIDSNVDYNGSSRERCKEKQEAISAIS